MFLKRLYRYLEYDGYNVRGNLKYLITSEYGGTTFRPHLHPLFFCKIPGISSAKLNEYIVKAWKDIPSQTKLGFNDKRNVDKRVINSIYGIKYVVKYILKDDAILDCIKYHKETQLSQFFFNYCAANDKNFDKLLYPELRQIFLSYKYRYRVPDDYSLFNFVMVSHGLGLYFLDNVNYEDLFNDILIMDQSPKQYTQYSVPSYFVRKVFYKYENDTKRYIPNDLTAQLKRSQDEKMILSFKQNARKLEDIYNSLSLKSLDTLCHRYHLDRNVQSWTSYIDQILDGREMSHFVKYVVYFRNVHIAAWHEWLYDDNLSRLDNSFIELYTDYRDNAALYGKVNWRTDLPFNSHPEVNVTDAYSTNILFNHLPVFKDYDILYSFIKDVLYFSKMGKEKIYEQKQKEIEKYHAHLKRSMNNNVLFNS